MAFFLIGRGPHDSVRLLSSALYPTRHDAMAELSRLSAEAGFDFWDDEVFVADLDQSAPVLLVRPAGAPAAVEVEDSVADVWEADLPAIEQTEAPADVEALAAALEAEESHDELREALLRTTAFMAAEGIEAPASAGLGEPEFEDVVAEEEPHTDADTEDVQEAAEMGQPEEAAAQSEAQGTPDEAEASDAAEEPQTADEAPAAWPWDALSADQVAEEPATIDAADVYEVLEAPAAVIEEESDFILDLDAIAPVAYESPTEDTEAHPTAAEDLEVAAEAASPEAADAEAPETAGPLGEVSMGLEIELEEYEVAEPLGVPAEATTGYAGYTAESSLTEYTCNDCVYVETCPNRDQRQPRDCGSFQWK